MGPPNQLVTNTKRHVFEDPLDNGGVQVTTVTPASTSHTTGATRHEAGSMGVGSMDRSSVSYRRDSVSALAFWEPGLYDIVNLNQVKYIAHLAWRGFSLFAARMYSTVVGGRSR